MGAVELLKELEILGVSVSVDGDEVVLRPGSRVPSDMIPPLRQAKAEILGLLVDDADGVVDAVDYGATACICDQPIGPTGPERCGTCQLPLLCPNCPGCRGCKLAVKFGRARFPG